MASPAVTAQMVGNAFVTQYYGILHQAPNVVFRFYTDASRLTRAEAGSTGEVQTASSQDEIHRVVMSMGYKESKSEILTVDALDSFGGSVFVLVTGAMHTSNGTRKFVQSFFLAPQDRGYYVLNDIFRYLDEEMQQSASSSAAKGSNGVLEMFERMQVTSEAVPEMSNVTSSTVREEASIADEQDFTEHTSGAVPDVEQPAVEDVVPYQTTEAPLPEMLTPVEQVAPAADAQLLPVEEVPAGKKSYASALKAQTDGISSSPRFQPPSASSQKYPQVKSSSQLAPVPAHAEPKQEPSLVENEGIAGGIYVRNLPSNMTDSQLESELGKFGPVKPNSISLRSNKDGSLYAFADFEDVSSAQAAIEASPVLIGGRKAHIEERKSTYTGGRGRARGQSRGMPRGRGISSTASGWGSSPAYGDGDAQARGRGIRPVRGGYGTRATSS